ncbi:MAG: hypothetical protein K2O33_04810 [Muribaculaceae bacterium]|nr:hypothetical protein [Muribaculaceae bacterium]
MTPLISDAAQFVSGVGGDASNLIDGSASTECRTTGMSFTVRLPHGLTNGTPFRVRFTVPAGAEEIPTGFSVFGMHDDNGVLKSETAFGYTNAKITYDNGTVEYESPTFYVRNEFRDQYWYCTHLRFDCTETLSEAARFFRLAEFQICLYEEFEVGEGAVLRNDGDIINAAGIDWVPSSWYKPLIDEVGHSYWNAAEYNYIWQSATGLIVTPQRVSEPTTYVLKVGRPSADLKATGFPTALKWSFQRGQGGIWTEGGNIDLSDVQAGEIWDVDFVIRP